MLPLVYRAIRSIGAACVLLIVACSGDQQDPAALPSALKRVVVYSAIDTELIRPILDEYSVASNIPVLYINDSDSALFEKMRRKGLAEPADLYIGRDAGTLWYAADKSMLRPVNSEILLARVQERFRDPDATWFGLSLRARAIVYNIGAVSSVELSDYAALGDEQWHGRLCLSSSALPDNRSLVAMLISTEGLRSAEQTVRRWIRNLARPVYADDEQLVQAIEAGQCGVGIAGLSVAASRNARNSVSTIEVHLPDESIGGTHVDISGAGVTRHATNPDGARALLEWLLSESAQQNFAAAELQFPVSGNAEVPAVLAPHAGFDASKLLVEQFGYLAQDAADLAVRAHYP